MAKKNVQEKSAVESVFDTENKPFDMSQVANDADPETTETQLERAVKLGALLLEQKSEVTRLEDELSAAKKKVTQTEQFDLPDLMQELKLTTFGLETGEMIELSSDLKCNITEERKPDALQWLIDHTFGGLIKTEVVIPFDRGGHAAAMALYDDLIEVHEEATLKESVHAATLKSFVKEQMEKGTEDFPMELFGVFQYKVVKVVIPKKKKGA